MNKLLILGVYAPVTQYGLLIKNIEIFLVPSVLCLSARMEGPPQLYFYLLSKYVLFQLLTNHYERCWKYYCLPSGWGNFGAASEEELHLSRKLFWGIFDALSQKASTFHIHLLL